MAPIWCEPAESVLRVMVATPEALSELGLPTSTPSTWNCKVPVVSEVPRVVLTRANRVILSPIVGLALEVVRLTTDWV